jgi:chromate transport protein ChrA
MMFLVMARRRSEISSIRRGCMGSKSSQWQLLRRLFERMARRLCPDRERATITIGAAMVVLKIPSAPFQIGVIVACTLIGGG